MDKVKIKFILTDFLGYLFPGIATLTAIWVIHDALIPSSQKLQMENLNIASGIIGLAIAYALGVLSSSLASQLFKLDESKDSEIVNPLKNKYLIPYSELLKTEFEKIFDIQSNWGVNQFYMMRALLQQFQPNLTAIPERQNALRQLRRNIVIPSIVWGIALLVTGTTTFFSGPSVTGWNSFILPLFSLGMGAVFIFIFPVALIRGMRRNRAFEVRDNAMHFLLWCKLGSIKKIDEQTHPFDAAPPRK